MGRRQRQRQPARRPATSAAARAPGARAAARIPAWPKVSRRRALADEHAREVWGQARAGMVNRAEGLMAHVGGDPRAFAGQVDLAFLATVAGHLRRCPRCWLVWVDSEVPAELLTAAVRRTPAWEVFRVLVREIGAQRRAGGPQRAVEG